MRRNVCESIVLVEKFNTLPASKKVRDAVGLMLSFLDLEELPALAEGIRSMIHQRDSVLRQRDGLPVQKLKDFDI